MDELIQKISSALNAANGRALYSVIAESLTPKELAVLPRALQVAKANGSFRRELVRNPETGKPELFLTTAPVPQEG